MSVEVEAQLPTGYTLTWVGETGVLLSPPHTILISLTDAIWDPTSTGGVPGWAKTRGPTISALHYVLQSHCCCVGGEVEGQLPTGWEKGEHWWAPTCTASFSLVDTGHWWRLSSLLNRSTACVPLAGAGSSGSHSATQIPHSGSSCHYLLQSGREWETSFLLSPAHTTRWGNWSTAAWLYRWGAWGGKSPLYLALLKP